MYQWLITVQNRTEHSKLPRFYTFYSSRDRSHTVLMYCTLTETHTFCSHISERCDVVSLLVASAIPNALTPHSATAAAASHRIASHQ